MDMKDAATVAGSPLYEACVGYMVAEQSHTNSWETIAKHVHELSAKGTSYKDVKRILNAIETQVKADFKVTALPTAWRSAKSAALNAMKAGVPLLNMADGTVLGKTAVEQAAKGSKASKGKAPVSAADTVIQMLKNVMAMHTSITDPHHRRVIHNLAHDVMGTYA